MYPNGRRANSPPRQSGSGYRKWSPPGNSSEKGQEKDSVSSVVKPQPQGEKKFYGRIEVACHKPSHKRPDCPLRKDSSNDIFQHTSLKRVQVGSTGHPVPVTRRKKVPNVVFGTVNEIPTVLVVQIVSQFLISPW